MEAAIYVRLSQDNTGQGAGVERQEKECRALAASRGWTVTRIYSDNDTSATSGVARPGFEALLRDRPQRVVVWHTDRLARRTHDLERVIAAHMDVHAVQSGHLDLSNPAGRAVARTVTAWATYEGEHKAERQRASNRQKAEQGVSVWSRRPFGFDRDRHDVFLVEAEAEAIREAADRLLAGDTLASIARDLDARGIATATGGKWTVTSLKRVLLNPRVGGWITYNGQKYPSEAPAILDTETFDRLTSVLTDPRRRTAPSTRTKYLLSGLAWCGRCEDQRMFATTGSGISVLRCRVCYLTRQRERTEDFVREVVVARLSRPDLSDLLVSPEDVADVRAEIVSLNERREALTIFVSEGIADITTAREKGKALRAALDAAQRRLEALMGKSPMQALASAPDPAQAFLDASLTKQRIVVNTLIKVTILPVGRGTRWSEDGIEVSPA